LRAIDWLGRFRELYPTLDHGDRSVTKTVHTPDVRRAIDLFLTALRKDYAVDEVRLYGSRARGDFTEESDVDLAVVLLGERGDRWKTAMALADITFDVLVETGIAVSAYPLWQGDLDHPERANNPALIRNIQREGIRL
jgi:predicted nucleotidyltransferase